MLDGRELFGQSQFKNAPLVEDPSCSERSATMRPTGIPGHGGKAKGRVPKVLCMTGFISTLRQ